MADRHDLVAANVAIPSGFGPADTAGLADVAVRDGRIVDVRPAGGAVAAAADRLVDAAGGCILPGFVDCHTHLEWAAEDLWTVSWATSRDRDEAVAHVRETAERVDGADFWITGGDWTRDELPDGELPSRADLDGVAANPMLLRSRDGAVAVLNSRALALCRIDRDTPDPLGGRIERSADGPPTGRLFGEAAWSRIAVGVVPPRNRHGCGSSGGT
ncbi:MAG: amidohydrolase family protein [Nitriliruptorales bacterium]